ncbi:MAG: carbohydrate kinase family protein [bacterium]
MAKKIIVIGSVLRDIILVVNSGKIAVKSEINCEKILGFELGAKNNIVKFLNTTGGSGANVSVGLKKMGLDPIPNVEVGDDLIGQAVKEDLGKYKISGKLIRKDNKKQTGFSFIVVDEATREHILFSSKEASEDIGIDVKKILSLRPDWIYLGSLGKNPEDEFEKIKLIKKKNSKIQIAINPGISQIENKNKQLLGILKICDLLIMNRDEAISMVLKSEKEFEGIPDRGLNQIRFLFEKSKKWGPKIVAITDGEDGAYLKQLSSKKLFYGEGARVSNIADTTGAGDAFSSGVLAGIIHKKSLEDCLRIGIANGAGVVQILGAHEGLLDWKAALRKIKKIKVLEL